ncbi:MAG: phenylalanine--tRNA ligase subunit beta [Candidatus Paceibacterota bacterium]
MNFSYNWLQKYFTDKLPPPADLAEQITFHSSELEELVDGPHGKVLDLKVLPDKSAWLMSHRGVAKEVSAILALPLKDDPFLTSTKLDYSDDIKIVKQGLTCDYYSVALIEGVKVGPSPRWLRDALEDVGQRSINNIVDATNYVMFDLGQPLHAFAADKLGQADGQYQIGVRYAKAEESIVTLTGESYELSAQDSVIVDQTNDAPIGIAGVKGGKLASVDESTTKIMLEAAHFDRKAVRATARSLKLQTDASKRYENGISVGVVPIALSRAIDLILEVAGGKLVTCSESGDAKVSRAPVTCDLKKINSVLGLSLTMAEVIQIISRFGYESKHTTETVTVYPPFERDDLVIAEDLIEEIGRIYGLHHIVSIVPEKREVTEYNSRHYYAEKVRTALVALGFSEVYTSSFRSHDEVKIENALASDKGYLRSILVENLKEAVSLNSFNRDILGLKAIKIFEIGTVFAKDSEEFRIALAVLSGTNYKAKLDDPILEEALEALAKVFGQLPEFNYRQDGVVEFSLEKLLPKLTPVHEYDKVDLLPKINYKAFSVYPAISRDVAMWVTGEVSVAEVEAVLAKVAGPLCVLITHLDTFSKEGKTSYAFRLVFQSFERTLTDVEVQGFMDSVYNEVVKQGWEAR